MRMMKESGIDWIGLIPINWTIDRIKSQIETHFGGCWGRDYAEELQSHARLCIRIADFDFGTQSIKPTADTLRVYTNQQISINKLRDNDIIVEKSGGGEKTPVGRTVLFRQKNYGENEVLFANFCECWRLRNVNPMFFAYLMKSFYYSNDMKLFFNQTTGLQNLDVQTLINANVAYPPLDEQDKIVNFLNYKCNVIDSISTKIDKQIETLEKYKKSIITELITKGLNSNVELKDSGIKWIGNIPAHWKVLKIKDGFIRKKSKAFQRDPVVLSLARSGVKIRDISTNEGQLAASYFEYNPVAVDDMLLNPMDLQSGANCSISKVEGVISPAYVNLRYKDGFNPKFYDYYFKIQYWSFAFFSYGKGVSFDNRWTLNEDTLMRLPLIVPSIEEQNAITKYLDNKCDEIDRIISSKKSQLEYLDSYKKSLIYEYVTGKKEVAL